MRVEMKKADTSIPHKCGCICPNVKTNFQSSTAKRGEFFRFPKVAISICNFKIVNFREFNVIILHFQSNVNLIFKIVICHKSLNPKGLG
ncbi:hypothetical protein LCGC14_3024670, partial [marine sediment metagenome]